MSLNHVVIAISGASGSIYGIRALQLLKEMKDVRTHLTVTPSAKSTIGVETNFSISEIEELADEVHSSRDIGASIASGSFKTSGMIVAPCSIKSLSAIANSFGADLVSRAADVTLKERRPLILMVRETPFHLGHLRLMTKATEMGAVISPPIPAFYNNPESLEDVIDHSVGRALEHLGFEVSDLKRWEGR
ncbi:MAG: 3-octaprenyl-4-hydroxybenzoate carboxy-lyase [Acidimicrobiaceae bacterium]|nr:3-octaprenyl-4-hydroxybenzoate carboxy-lyase [Acidimicrobiaceae bacterium]